MPCGLSHLMVGEFVSRQIQGIFKVGLLNAGFAIRSNLGKEVAIQLGPLTNFVNPLRAHAGVLQALVLSTFFSHSSPSTKAISNN